MSSTRVIRYTQTFNNYSLVVGQQLTNETRLGFPTQYRKEWDTTNQGYNTVQLTSVYSESNDTSPESGQSILGFEPSETLLITFQGIPADRCKVNLYGRFNTTLSEINGNSASNHLYDCEQLVLTPTKDLDCLSISKTSLRLRYQEGEIDESTTFTSGGLPITFQWPEYRTYKKTGSAIILDTADVDELITTNIRSIANVSIAFNIYGSGDPDPITIKHTASFTGTLTRTWEATNHIIDGVDGDNAPNISSNFTFNATAKVNKLAESNLESISLITADSIKIIGSAISNLSNNFSTSFIGNIKSDTTKTLSTQCELLATTNNFVFGVASIDSAFTQSQTPTLITDITKTLSSTTTQTASAGLIYDIAGDYTWDSLTDTWNDWPFDTWDRPYNVVSAFDIDESLLFKLGATSSLIGVFGLDDTSPQANLSAIFSSSFTAQGIIDQGSSITSNFSTTALANTIYDAIADFDGVLSAELIANLIIGSLLATPSSQFTLASSPTFKPGGEVDMSAAFEILDKLGNMIYGPDVDLSAFYSQLTVGSIYQTADFYNTFKILQETRNILIGIENRQYIISEEKRLNTIKAESRNVLVPEETRRFKLKVAPITNRFTTPKVRSPQ